MLRDMFKGVVTLCAYIMMLLVFYVFFVRTAALEGIQISVFGGLVFESITKFLELITIYYLSKMIVKNFTKQPTSYIKYAIIALIIIIVCMIIMSGIDTLILLIAKNIEYILFNTNILGKYTLTNWFLFELLPYKQPIFDINMIENNISAMQFGLWFVGKIFLYYFPVALCFLMPLYTLKFSVKKPINQHIVNVIREYNGEEKGYKVYYSLSNFKRRKALVKVIQLSFIFIIINFMVWNKNFIIYPFLIVILKLYFATVFWNDNNKRVYKFYDIDTKELVKFNEDIDYERVVDQGLVVERCEYDEYMWKKANGFTESLKEVVLFLFLIILSILWVYVNYMMPINISLYARDMIDFILTSSSIFIVGNMIFKKSVRYTGYNFLLVSSPIIIRLLIQIVLFVL